MDILENLIQIRKEKKIDQKHFLHTLGISATTMSRYENKKREMPHSIMVKFANELGYEMRLLKK